MSYYIETREQLSVCCRNEETKNFVKELSEHIKRLPELSAFNPDDLLIAADGKILKFRFIMNKDSFKRVAAIVSKAENLFIRASFEANLSFDQKAGYEFFASLIEKYYDGILGDVRYHCAESCDSSDRISTLDLRYDGFHKAEWNAALPDMFDAEEFNSTTVMSTAGEEKEDENAPVDPVMEKAMTRFIKKYLIDNYTDGSRPGDLLFREYGRTFFNESLNISSDRLTELMSDVSSLQKIAAEEHLPFAFETELLSSTAPARIIRINADEKEIRTEYCALG